MTSIAFIGVGNMGGPMARNLLKAEHALTAFDLSEQVLAPVVKAGASKAASANEAVKDAGWTPQDEHERLLSIEDRRKS